jgi:hypothetical protein
MDDERKKSNWPMIAALLLAVLLLPVAAYFGGYFALGGIGTLTTGHATCMCRAYPAQWQADIFRPAAKVESFFTGQEVKTAYIPGR